MRETVPNRERLPSTGKGTLPRSVPRNLHQDDGADDVRSGELRIRWRFLRVTPDSDVKRKTKSMANAGSSAAAGVVPGAWWLENQVIERP